MAGRQTNLPEGMSLRDWFAGQALVGALSQPWHPDMGWGPGYGSPAAIAIEAYNIADAMIAEKERREEEEPA